jgi:hypothetical protein
VQCNPQSSHQFLVSRHVIGIGIGSKRTIGIGAESERSARSESESESESESVIRSRDRRRESCQTNPRAENPRERLVRPFASALLCQRRSPRARSTSSDRCCYPFRRCRYRYILYACIDLLELLPCSLLGLFTYLPRVYLNQPFFY